MRVVCDCVVRAVMTKYRDERDAAVERCAKADPGQHQFENCEINVPQEHR